MTAFDDDREVDLSDDGGLDILPDQTRDDTDAGWGERRSPVSVMSEDDRRLLDERPPHWD